MHVASIFQNFVPLNRRCGLSRMHKPAHGHSFGQRKYVRKWNILGYLGFAGGLLEGSKVIVHQPSIQRYYDWFRMEIPHVVCHSSEVTCWSAGEHIILAVGQQLGVQAVEDLKCGQHKKEPIGHHRRRTTTFFQRREPSFLHSTDSLAWDVWQPTTDELLL